MATLKPTTPLRAPNKGPLKPASPLCPKTAPKTPISRPQRRWRFQSRLGRRPQRRWRFQTTGPAGLQGQAAVPVGGGRAWPGDQWAADVTNVVKPTRFTSPHEDPCYKRCQSGPKNQHFQRKHPKNSAHQARQHGDVETNNTTARHQQGTVETDITTAPENCTKNAHFTPAKAMAVSLPHRHKRAKAMAVSDNRPSWPTGPGCDART